MRGSDIVVDRSEMELLYVYQRLENSWNLSSTFWDVTQSSTTGESIFEDRSDDIFIHTNYIRCEDVLVPAHKCLPVLIVIQMLLYYRLLIISTISYCINSTNPLVVVYQQ